MRRKRGGASSRDDEFNRNNSRYSRENSPLERQLFDPRSDNPIHFNRTQTQVCPTREDTQRQTDDNNNSKKQTRTLWTGDEEKLVKAPTPPRIMERRGKSSNNKPTDITKKIETKPAPLTEDELNRRKLKTLISSIHSVEASISKVAETARQISCFTSEQPKETSRYQEKEKKETIMTDQNILEAEKIWREKISLHLLLGSKYLDVLKLDPEYAEKKGLESLCWKRAIHSLVEQFRNALKNSSSLLQEAKNKKKKKIPIFNNELDDLELTPIISDNEDEDTAQEMKVKLAKMTLSLFLEFLDGTDDFYQRLSVFLMSIDTTHDLDEMEKYLTQWRRTKAYKWFSCITIRGDIARYRWSYIPDKQDIVACSWTKQSAFEEAWKRYFLGVWLMPAKGNLYFNLSLLLMPEDTKSNTQGYGFHKLYFSVRSLMVRRNGFLNAREGIITLFESNRCWLNKCLETPSKSPNKKGANMSLKKTVVTTTNDLNSVPALFIRLHGMLFTKIGLDEFAKTKRIFFETLFPKRQRRELNERSDDGKQQAVKSLYGLSNSSQFWLEMIVLCLSSLYTYDYSNSKLGKVIANNKAQLFNEIDGQQKTQQKEQDLLDDMKNSILFINGIDLTCQIAVEIFQAYLDSFDLKVPELPELPYVMLELKENESFLFEKNEQETKSIEQESNRLSELIYIEVLLHWMVMNGICIQTQEKPSSLWEELIGDVDYDLVFKGNNRHTLSHERKSNISPAFWPLLLEFLTKLLLELPDNIKYEMINHHFLDNEEEDEPKMEDDDVSKNERQFSKDIIMLMGSEPELPEEQQLRGLGWVDETHGRLLKLGFKKKGASADKAATNTDDNTLRRKLKILNYGFILVKNLENVIQYDAVHEMFTVSKDLEEKLVLNHQNQSSAITKNLVGQEEEGDDEYLYNDAEMVDTISAMDDDVLLSNDTDYSIDEDEDDDIMTQLKKRREQLQSMIVISEKEQQTGYHRLPARVKERKARLNYLRQHIIPGKTVLILDTNCFIGHIDLVKKLVNSAKWSIVVPLVVITELDGLRSSTQRLGSAAQEAIELIEGVLAMKQRQNQSLRVQTSHNNFMSDISIRSEQFVFGETDKNLDDLVLSACLWWISQPHDKNTVPVCLVTGDRNLSVKARARDVQVAPVSAIMQLTPK